MPYVIHCILHIYRSVPGGCIPQTGQVQPEGAVCYILQGGQGPTPGEILLYYLFIFTIT
jgi:hypothetical protein